MKEGQNWNYEKKVPIKLQRGHQFKEIKKKRKEKKIEKSGLGERAADFGEN